MKKINIILCVIISLLSIVPAYSQFSGGANDGYAKFDVSLPNIIISSIPTEYCAGSMIIVPFTVANTFDPNNVFTVQLSNSTGFWPVPVNIGSLTSSSSGTIYATIPLGTAPGTGYRVRVISSSPEIFGSSNDADITNQRHSPQALRSFPGMPFRGVILVCLLFQNSFHY